MTKALKLIKEQKLKLSFSTLYFWRRQKLPLVFFLVLCFNLLVAPVVYAAANGIERGNAYAIGVLYLLTLALTIYLFVVVFQPERF